MAEIINLRRARKTNKRADAQREADANRMKHGRTKADKRVAEAAQRKHDALIDGARLDKPED